MTAFAGSCYLMSGMTRVSMWQPLLFERPDLNMFITTPHPHPISYCPFLMASHSTSHMNRVTHTTLLVTWEAWSARLYPTHSASLLVCIQTVDTEKHSFVTSKGLLGIPEVSYLAPNVPTWGLARDRFNTERAGQLKNTLTFLAKQKGS